MFSSFSFSQFISRFSSDDLCLEEIKRFRFPNGIYCTTCHATTKHYRVTGRKSYSCQTCRNHIYPLAGTIFEKTTTPLRLWFYAFFLMTHTRSDISAKQLQRELGVTYKTAWRIHKQSYMLMSQHNGDLLNGSIEFADTEDDAQGINKIHKWIFFNKIEFKVVQRHGSSS